MVERPGSYLCVRLLGHKRDMGDGAKSDRGVTGGVTEDDQKDHRRDQCLRALRR